MYRSNPNIKDIIPGDPSPRTFPIALYPDIMKILKLCNQTCRDKDIQSIYISTEFNVLVKS